VRPWLKYVWHYDIVQEVLPGHVLEASWTNLVWPLAALDITRALVVLLLGDAEHIGLGAPVLVRESPKRYPAVASDQSHRHSFVCSWEFSRPRANLFLPRLEQARFRPVSSTGHRQGIFIRSYLPFSSFHSFPNFSFIVLSAMVMTASTNMQAP
jgi:hypothetical protein